MGAVLCVPDGVTVVLYKVMQTLNLMEDIAADQIILGIVKFFVVCFGGLLIGVIAGVVTALLTRLTVNVGGNSGLFVNQSVWLCVIVSVCLSVFGDVSPSLTSICLSAWLSLCLLA